MLSKAITVSLAFFIAAIPLSECKAITGTVTTFDISAQTIAVKYGSSSIRFDLSNPVLKGYKNTAHIRKGDRIQIGYTARGVRVAKVMGEPVAPETSAPKVEKSVTKPGRHSSKVQRIRTRGSGFDDVDANKDGKVNPVELSVIVPNLTMEQFKGFDKDKDGTLNRSEFRTVNPGQ